MKKYLFPALALGLVMTSCQSDEPFAPGEGGEKQVTFTLNVPGELGTRAGTEGNNSGVGGFSNGQGTLYYTLVLDANGDTRVFKDATVSNDGRTATFTPTVVLGRDYTITAYASFDDNTSINAKADIEAITVSKNFNDETKDAYFHTTRYNFANGDLQPLTLRRPFGKLRLVATDYKAGGTALNTEIESVKVTYHDQQTATFNAVEGLFSYNGVNGDIEATKPFEGYYSSTADETTLFADYIPANSQDNMVDFTVEVKYAGSEETYYRRFNDIPVRRNSLTTLKGNFFTAGAQITVNVDDNFEEQNLFEKTVTVTTNDELTNAIANAVDNELIIFGGHIDGNVTAVQREGIDVIIDGCGHNYDGTIYIQGQSRNNGQETLTIQNVNFKASTSGRDFISANSTIESERYAHNVIVRNCSFEGNGQENVVAMRYRQTYNMKVENCVANNLFLLMWASGNEGTTIDGVTVNNPTGEGGVSIAKDTNVVIKNSTINAAGGYGIRAGGENETSITVSNLSVENTTIDAKQPIVVRYAVGDHNVALSGADLITNELYHVIFTKGNNNANYVAPEGTYTISGADDYNVFPMAAGAKVKATSQAQLTNAIKAGATNIVLAEGTYEIQEDVTGKTLEISGTGNPADVTLVAQNDGASEGNCDYCFRGSNVKFNNLTIQTTGTYYPGYAGMVGTFNNCIINGTYACYKENTFNNCTFNVEGDLYNLWTWGGEDVNLTNCTFNCDGKAVLLYGGSDTNLTVNNCVFNDNGGLSDLKAAIETGNDYNKSYNLVVNNTIVNGFAINDKGIYTGTTLWANKNSMPQEKLNVVVDGVDVY